MQICQEPYGHNALYDSLQSFIPGLTARLRLLPPASQAIIYTRDPLDDWHTQSQSQNYVQTHTSPLSISAGGDDLTGLGCFHLGLEVTPKDFTDILDAQRHLKDLDLLQRISEEELDLIGGQIRALENEQSSIQISSAASQAAKELLDLFTATNYDGTPRLQIYVGLHSGFQTSSEIQFWGLCDVDDISGVVTIYLSGKAQDRAEIGRTSCRERV